MRLWLFIALLFTTFQASAEPFLKNVQFSSYEFYDEQMQPVFEEPTLVSRYRFRVDITASISETEALLFDEDTPISLRVGNFSWEGTPKDDLDFDPDTRRAVIREPFAYVTDAESEPFLFGTITMDWSSLTTLTIRITFDSVSQEAGTHYFDVSAGEPEFYLWAYRNAIGQGENPDVVESDSAELSFGTYTQSALTYFVHGESTVSASGDDSLLRVELIGGTDSKVPTSVITSPPLPTTAPFTTLTASPYLFQGTARDTYQVGTTTVGISPATFTSTQVPKVEYYLSATPQLPTNAVWKRALVSATTDQNGNWTWQSATPEDLHVGFNYLYTRITDAELNETHPSPRQFKYATFGDLTLRGSSSGFSPADTGKTVGTVTGAATVFPKAKAITVRDNNGLSSTSDFRDNVEGGSIGRATAKPAPGSIFAGWTATVKNLAYTLVETESVKESITFQTLPDMVVIGNFISNPFLIAGTGTYFGITSGATAANRGTFTGKVATSGAFSGKLKLGTLTLPVKGKFLGSGFWKGFVTKKGVTYTVTLNVALGTPHKITGTIVANGLNASIVADLSTWKKKTNEATEYVGSYNVILPATAVTGTVPEGIGYGLVKISNVGKVKFAGKAGNGENISFSSVLYERSATEVIFPFFALVAKKLGNISGTVAYDATQPNSDLTATLLWAKPATLKVEPNPIDGQIALHGSKYTAPATGARVIFTATGNATLAIRGPSFTIPTQGSTAFLSGATTLGSDNKLGAVTDSPSVQKVTLKFAPKSGLFSGKFYDPILNKTFSFTGAASQQANGGQGMAAGVFTRGNRAGYVTLEDR